VSLKPTSLPARLIERRRRRPAVKPRVLIVSPSAEDGGVETYVRSFVRGGVDRGFELVVCLPNRPGLAPFCRDLNESGARTRCLVLTDRAPSGARQALVDLVRDYLGTSVALIRSGPGKVMLMLPHPEVSPGAVLAVALLRRGAVVVVHLVPPDLHVKRQRRMIYSLARRLGQSWVTVSNDNHRILTSALQWEPGAVKVVYNGVDDAFAADSGPSVEVRSRVRAELGVPDHARILLSVGRLNRQKGHDVILEGAERVLHDHPDVWWVWAGEGSERAALREASEARGIQDRVLMLGRVTNVKDLMRASDLLLFPSRYEGLPLAVLEANMAALAVIVSDAGSLPEVVRVDVDGLIVPVDDPEALASQTRWALSNPARMAQMAAAARERSTSMFTTDRMIDQTLEILLGDQAVSYA
jgi:glycosyltransferase involved in cell wall biosynthesis